MDTGSSSGVEAVAMQARRKRNVTMIASTLKSMRYAGRLLLQSPIMMGGLAPIHYTGEGNVNG